MSASESLDELELENLQFCPVIIFEFHENIIRPYKTYNIFPALVRVAPLSQGRITIDCVDIATLPLKELRSRIAIVPQEPFIFAGTVKENIDPHGFHLDSSIWNVINQCLATPLVVLH